MKKTLMAFAALALAAGAASAQGFADEPTCYSWEGGHKSSGSFSKCTRWETAKAPTAPPPPVVVPAPVMQTPACPPQVIFQEATKPKAKPRPRKPLPKCVP